MSDKTDIEWTDATWNPITGCTEVSPGCDHCYAKTFAERFRGVPGHHFEQGFDVVLRPDKLDLPLRWRKPKRVFVNSMSDLFHDDVPDEYIARVFAVMALAPRHTFQVLTKRHGRMRSLVARDSFRDEVAEEITELMASGVRADFAAAIKFDRKTAAGNVWGPVTWPLPNVWLGVSVENQQWVDIRIPALLDTPAAVRFLSCEPLLGPVDVTPYLRYSEWRHIAVDWVIVGGESGHGARTMHPDWARTLRDQCATAGTPFLFKQWGDNSLWIDKHGDVWMPGSDGLMHTPETAPFPREHVERKWGPLRALRGKVAGRELDGRTWDEFPEVASAVAS